MSERIQSLTVPTSRPELGLRAAALIAAYVFGFFGLLPVTLLRFGQSLDRELGLQAISGATSWLLGAPLCFAGGLLLAQAMLELWTKGRGLPISHLPPTELVRSGWYAKLRHPIYVGYSLAFAGIGCVLHSPGIAGAASAVLVLGWCAYAAALEEPMLLRRFGASYAERLARTRRVPFVSFGAKPWLWLWRALRPLAEWLARRPIFCRWGTSVWVGYGGLLAMGAAAAAALAVVTLPALLSPRALYTYVLGLVLSMLLGGRAAWLAYEWRALWTAPLSTLRRVGFVSFGAYAAMLLFVGVWPAQHGLWLLDRTLLACLVCSGFGRLGCLSYGCCYGRPWEHGMRADSADSKVVRERGEAGRSPRVPTQLLHSLLAFFSAGLAGLLLLSAAAPGFAALLTALVYAFGRFGIENYRDEPRFVAGRLTRGQLLATAIGLTALVGIAFAPLGFHGDPSLLESLTPTALLDVRYWPLLLLSALSVLLVCGYHRNKVGAW